MIGLILRWLEEIRDNTSSADVSVIIVGNKKDLAEERQVTEEQGKALAEENQTYFLETSALDNSDNMIERVFTTLVTDILKRKQNQEDDEEEIGGGKQLSLKDETQAQKKKKKACC